MNIESPQPKQTNYLLAIAIDKYSEDSGYLRLTHPVCECKRFVEAMKTDYGFDSANVKTLYDEEAIKDDILVAIDDLMKKISADDQVVVFFSGHGAINNNSGYWITHDGKPRTILNLSISDILDSLAGGEKRPKQLLLIVDCCFSGAITDQVYPRIAFSANEEKRSQFNVITCGNRYNESPNRSIFMEAILNMLSTRCWTNFNSFAGDIYTDLLRKGNSNITTFSTINQDGTPFILQRPDKVAFELKKSFYELNYEKQSVKIKNVALFNLVYIRGTKECGHHIFTQKYFKDNGFPQVNMFDFAPRIIKFGGDSSSADYNLWGLIGTEFRLDRAQPNVILQRIFRELESRDWVVIVKIDGSVDNEALENTLCDFWTKVDEFIASPDYIEPDDSNRFYFFIWDRRGDAEDRIEDNWKQKSDTLLAKPLHLPPIESLTLMGDLGDWKRNISRNYPSLKATKAFNKLDLTEISEPMTIENVINQLARLFDRKELYHKLFNQQNIWLQ